MKRQQYFILGVIVFLLIAYIAGKQTRKQAEEEVLIPDQLDPAGMPDQERLPERQSRESERQIVVEKKGRGYHFREPVISAAEALTYQPINLPEKVKDKFLQVWQLAEQDNLLVGLGAERGQEPNEIGLWNWREARYQPLVEAMPAQRVAAIGDYRDGSIAYWRYDSPSPDNAGQNSQPPVVQLWLFDRRQAQERMIYEYQAAETFGEAMLWEDKLYFETLNQNGTQRCLYEYDRKAQKTEKVKEDYQKLVCYQQEPAVIAKSRTEGFHGLYRLSGQEIELLPPDIGQVSANDSGIFEIKPIINKSLGAAVNTLYDLLSGKELLYTDEAITALNNNAYYVWWQVDGEERPLLYSVTQNCFLLFKDLPKASAQFKIQGDSGLLIVPVEEAGEAAGEYYYFTPKK